MRFFIIIISVFVFFNISAQRDTTIQNWTFGAEKGFAQIAGEVDVESGFAFGFFAEKHFSNIFSARLQLGMGGMQGQDLTPSNNWLNHPVWNGKTNAAINYNNALAPSVYNNFSTSYMEGSLQAIFNFSQLSFFKNKSKFDGFLLGGFGVMQYETKVDAADLVGNIYEFSTLNPAEEDRILPNLNNLMDGKYETSFHAKPEITPLYQAGAGIKWRFKKNLILALSHRISWTGKDDLDGSQWNEKNELDNVNDLYHFSSLSLSYTFFKTKKVDIPKQLEPIIVPPVIEPEIIEEAPEPVVEEIVEPEPTVELEPTKEEKILFEAIDKLEFETNQAIISSSSFNSLDDLASLLNENKSWKLKIQGHTDNVGNPSANLKLSKERAEAVANYLSRKGVAYNRLKVSWYGENRPIATNDTEEGRQQNRRVEMEILE
ncbi:MAG: OmpA family protein [Saprospiraceae bacterium]